MHMNERVCNKTKFKAMNQNRLIRNEQIERNTKSYEKSQRTKIVYTNEHKFQ